MEDAFTAAWEKHVQQRWGGWTEFAKVHSQASAASERNAFRAGFAAGLVAKAEIMPTPVPIIPFCSCQADPVQG